MSQAISFRRRDSIQQPQLSPTASSLSRWKASPLSFKMGSLVGSLGTRLYHAPGCSPIPGLDSTDFMMPNIPMSSSIDQSRLLQALSTSTDGDTSNYTCCGLPLIDLHALLDHFEESHVLVLDHQQLQHPPFQQPPQQPQPEVVPPSFHDEMPLGSMELDPIDVDLDDSPSGSGSSSSSSSSSSPHLGPSNMLNSNMNPYYADFRSLMAAGGAAPSITTSPTAGVAAPSSFENPSSSSAARASQAQCIPPALLFSPVPSPTSSRPQSSSGPALVAEAVNIDDIPAAMNPQSPEFATPSSSSSGDRSSPPSPSPMMAILNPQIVNGPGIIHPGPPPPTAAPSSLAKPFKCPTPNCNKSYKQANGLKYHLQHGQCCFIPKDPALEGLDEIEKDKVERPFGCGVGGCERRYKNMNGLRYHYQHSGAHGVKGLELLNAGLHSVQLAAASAAKAGRSGGAHSRSSSIGATKPDSSRATTPTPNANNGTQTSNATPSGISRTATAGPSGISRAVTAAAQTLGVTDLGTKPVATPQPQQQQQQQMPQAPMQNPVAASSMGPPRPPNQPAVYPYAQYALQYQTVNGGVPQQNGYPVIQRQAVFPPHHPQGQITSTIAAMAGAFGAGYSAQQIMAAAQMQGYHPQQMQMQMQQPQPQRPHQLLRKNSSGTPTTMATAVNVSSSGNNTPIVTDMDMDMTMAMDSNDTDMMEG